MCNDPFLELGMTLRPKHLKCFEPAIATKNIEVNILFKEHVDAEKWNKMHEARIRKSGHFATIALGVFVQMITKNPVLSTTVGSTASIAKDEVQAKIWYPKMFKGWRLIRYYKFSYKQFPHQKFIMSWTDVLKNENAKEVERRNHGQCYFTVGGPFGIPDKLVRKIMTQCPIYNLNFK